MKGERGCRHTRPIANSYYQCGNLDNNFYNDRGLSRSERVKAWSHVNMRHWNSLRLPESAPVFQRRLQARKVRGSARLAARIGMGRGPRSATRTGSVGHQLCVRHLWGSEPFTNLQEYAASKRLVREHYLYISKKLGNRGEKRTDEF